MSVAERRTDNRIHILTQPVNAEFMGVPAGREPVVPRSTDDLADPDFVWGLSVLPLRPAPAEGGVTDASAVAGDADMTNINPTALIRARNLLMINKPLRMRIVLNPRLP